MKKFRFRGKKYAWQWEGCPVYNAIAVVGVVGFIALVIAYIWLLTSGIIIMFEPQV